jgi:hypothetical protein
MMKFWGRYIFMLLAAPMLSLAQSDCRNTLYDAGKLFEAGRFQDCISTLETCYKGMHNKEERFQAYRLLAQSYLNLNNKDEANLFVMKMLKLKPDYQVFPNIDPIDFSRLVNRYKVQPGIYLGLKTGLNITTESLKKSYSLFVADQYYSPARGYNIGFEISQVMSRRLMLSYELSSSRFSISHTIPDAGNYMQLYSEEENFTDLHINGIFKLLTVAKLSFNLGLGGGAGYLYSSNINLTLKNLTSGEISQHTKDALPERNRLQPFLSANASLQYALNRGVLTLAGGYSYYFMNTVKSSERMRDADFIFNYHYVNDDIALRVTSFNIGYKIPVHWNISLKK